VKLALVRTSRQLNIMPLIPSPANASAARTAACCRALRSEGGFSLIEVLVSALMVALIASATAVALISTTHASASQRLHSQADSIASQDQDRLRGLSDAQLNGLNQSRNQSEAGTVFQVTSRATYLDTTGVPTCTSSSVAYYKITSVVSWSEPFTKQGAAGTSVTVGSLLARPIAGGLLVQVKNEAGASLPGVSVGAVGPDTQSGTTDSNGCVLFGGMIPGGYVATLADPGYVDPNGNSSPTATATVTGTGVQTPAPNPVYMGQAGSVIGTFTTSGTAPGEADGLSWLGTGTAPSGMSGGFQTAPTVDPALPLTTVTSGLLFPFYRSVGTVGYGNNYVVWGGRCAGQQPPSGYTSATVNPGVLGQAYNVQEPLLDLASVKVSTTPVKPVHVKLSYSSGGCTDSWPATVTTATTMPATGWLANPGQPYAAAGTLTVCADYKSGSTYYKGTSAATGNTSFATVVTSNSVPTITMTTTSSTNLC
jgi:type II secretory pathway pseudopilin PulG